MSLPLIYGWHMRNERKFAYQAKKIHQLEEALKQAKSSAAVLENENRSIRRKYEAALETIERMKLEHQAYAEGNAAVITGAIEARKQYEALIAECFAAKSEYEKQMTKLIGGIGNTGRH